MAKEKNRSQEIRAILDKDPAAPLKAIKAGLAKRGIEVSDSLIKAVKYSKPKTGPGKRGRKAISQPKLTSVKPGHKAVSQPKPTPAKRGRKAATRRGSAAGQTSFDALLGAKSLADKLGGVRRAQQAMDMLDRLR